MGIIVQRLLKKSSSRGEPRRVKKRASSSALTATVSGEQWEDIVVPRSVVTSGDPVNWLGSIRFNPGDVVRVIKYDEDCSLQTFNIEQEIRVSEVKPQSDEDEEEDEEEDED